MNKRWNKNQDNGFSLIIDNREIGQMRFPWSNMKKGASFHIGQQHFSISSKGFLNSTLLITDQSEKELVKMYAEKWYANNWVIEYRFKNYKLSVRNNPLAEYIITDGEKLILAYGLLAKDGKVQVKITGMHAPDDYLLDFLLWYLFAPVAMENIGDHLNFSELFNQ